MAGLEDRREEFAGLGANVLAINPASVEAHQKWSVLLGLNFPILSDKDMQVIKAYGCKMPLLPIVRRTVYVIGGDGRVVFAERGMADWDDVKGAIRR